MRELVRKLKSVLRPVVSTSRRGGRRFHPRESSGEEPWDLLSSTRPGLARAHGWETIGGAPPRWIRERARRCVPLHPPSLARSRESRTTGRGPRLLAVESGSEISVAMSGTRRMAPPVAMREARWGRAERAVIVFAPARKREQYSAEAQGEGSRRPRTYSVRKESTCRIDRFYPTIGTFRSCFGIVWESGRGASAPWRRTATC